MGGGTLNLFVFYLKIFIARNLKIELQTNREPYDSTNIRCCFSLPVFLHSCQNSAPHYLGSQHNHQDREGSE